jgi:hypothetical protein
MNTENDQRAKRCAQAIRGYNDEWDEKSNLIDFLADARHWCDRNNECYGDIDRTAYQHYLAELTDSRRQK